MTLLGNSQIFIFVVVLIREKEINRENNNKYKNLFEGGTRALSRKMIYT